LTQKIEVCSPRLQVTAIDPVSYFNDCGVDRCRTAVPTQLGDHKSIDVVDLVPALGPVMHDGSSRVREHESCAQRVEQELDDAFDTAHLVGGESEGRQERIAERNSRIESFLART
jgi:hypothetical protein